MDILDNSFPVNLYAEYMKIENYFLEEVNLQKNLHFLFQDVLLHLQADSEKRYISTYTTPCTTSSSWITNQNALCSLLRFIQELDHRQPMKELSLLSQLCLMYIFLSQPHGPSSETD